MLSQIKKYLLVCSLFLPLLAHGQINELDQSISQARQFKQDGRYYTAKEIYLDLLPKLEENEAYHIIYIDELARFAEILNELQDYNGAIDICLKAIHLAPQYGSNIATFSRILSVLGDSYVALSDYGMAFSVHDIACNTILKCKESCLIESASGNHICWHEDICGHYTTMLDIAIALEEYDLADDIVKKSLPFYESRTAKCKEAGIDIFDNYIFSVFNVFNKQALNKADKDQINEVEYYYEKVRWLLSTSDDKSLIPASIELIDLDVIKYLINRYLDIDRGKAVQFIANYCDLRLKGADRWNEIGYSNSPEQFLIQKSLIYSKISEICEKCGMYSEAVMYGHMYVKFREEHNHTSTEVSQFQAHLKKLEGLIQE